jgi:hypothetical protein
LPHTIDGTLVPYLSDNSIMLNATINVPHVGRWQLKLEENFASGSRRFIGDFVGATGHMVDVAPGPTDPLVCEVDSPANMDYGGTFSVNVTTFDAERNPTSHLDDAFTVFFKDLEDESASSDLPLVRITNASSSSSAVFSFTSKPIEQEGVVFFEIVDAAGVLATGKSLFITVGKDPSTEEELRNALIGAGAAFLLILGAVYRFQQKSKRSFAREIQMKSRNLSDAQQAISRIETENALMLQELKNKKHSEEELEIMMRAMEEMDPDKKNELKEVLIDSKNLKVERMLGKGG